MIRKILKFCLYTVVILAFASAIALLVIFKQWPWWVGAALGAGILSLLFGLLFLKRYLLQSRERKFVNQVIAQDTDAIGHAPRQERMQLRELQEKWKASVDLLRQSNLKKLGNPLYVLPWYMVMGEAGSGKTTAIKNSKINSPVSEVSTGIAGTRNFDWWFFDEAIILDTAGRYSIPIDQEPDREEWERFLSLLAKYRKKEPLNGVILAVSADQLLTKSSDDLRENGLNLRKRIDQLMRVCGAKFPVYLMVTKTDRVHGFNQFSSLLPEDRLSQAMGYSSSITGYWQDFLDSAHRFVSERLKDLRLLIIQNSTRVDPGVLMFPDEFEKLYAGLSDFAEGVFHENPYQETPMLTGIYYSSGKQEGRPCSEFVNNFKIECSEPANPRNGIFLRDFFKKILPGDRNLFLPIMEYFRWRRITKQFGLAAWCLLCLCLLGLISFSYIKNTDAIDKIARHAENPPVFTNDASTDLLMLTSYGRQLEKIRQFNRNWRLPRFGLDHSLRVEQKFVDAYVESFRTQFLGPMDRRLEENIYHFNENTDNKTIADYAAHIVSRIRVLDHYLEGKTPESKELLTDISSEILLVMDEEMLNDITLEFGRNYYNYVELADDHRAVEEKRKTLQELLSRLLEVRSMNLGWLTEKKMPDITPIDADRYWGESENPSGRHNNTAIAAAYTRQGKQHISSFMDRVEQIIGSSPGLDNSKKAFWQRYENDFLQAWANFALSFPQTPDMATSEAHRTKLAKSMTTENNPYFRLLSEMADELEAVDNPPAWAATILEVKKIRSTRTESEDDHPSLVDRIRDKGSSAVGKTMSVTSPEKAEKRKTRLEAARIMQKYFASLGDLQPVVNRPETAYMMASQFFSQNEAGSDSKSVFHSAHDLFSSLANHLQKNGDPEVAEELLKGPLDYLADFAAREAENIIQKKWEEKVLADTRGMNPDKVPYTIFKRQGGAVWDFINGPAKPFIKRGKNGFRATTALGQSISFRNNFFMFLDQGAEGTVDVQSSYTVRISTLPVQVNQGARAEPYGVFLNLTCADGQTQLKNFNFRETRKFKWEMDQCGDVEITILMPDTRLNYNYEGNMGFAMFLKDFRDGVKNFKPEDFPEQSRLLKDLGISKIRVAYEIKNASPVINLLDDVPKQVPENIVAEK